MNKFAKDMEKFAYNKIAPVLVEYTKWILNECQKRNLNKVYFLARDGYVLREIAKEICDKNNLAIDCRYLYCSRFSLRIPSYHLIGEERYEKLFLKGYYHTAQSVMQRAGMTEKEIEKLCLDLSINSKDAPLNDTEYNSLTKQLKENDFFKEKLDEKSKEAYGMTIKYFQEQGLFDDENIVIVDSGWTGSMQRSLRQLVEAAGYKGKITGFYFGLIESQKKEDGEYLTYYFSKKHGKKRKIMFNCNVFECMLSANHGMTLGYQEKDNKIVPVLKDTDNKTMLELINTQLDSIVKFAKENNYDLLIKNYDLEKSLKRSYAILKQVMIYPSKEEVELLANFAFCDDVTEGYSQTLADKNLTKALKQNMIIPRLFKAVFRKRKISEKPLFWPYGVVAYQPKILRPWYRFNLKLWDWFRFTLK